MCWLSLFDGHYELDMKLESWSEIRFNAAEGNLTQGLLGTGLGNNSVFAYARVTRSATVPVRQS